MADFIVTSINAGVYIAWAHWLYNEEQSRYWWWCFPLGAIGYSSLHSLDTAWATI
jgi:hypothetical protein